MTEDLKLIKKLYGEKMMHFCRDFFSSILETKGLLSKILHDNFAPSHELYKDLLKNNMLEGFKNYIYDLFYKEDKKAKSLDVQTPQELMRQAGYILYECKTEEDIQKFKKYYAKNEELCTFNGGRLNSCYVFFAIKDNVDEIKRETFLKPERQDLYGTSVISIQFSRDKSHTLSIKNRYNHRVANPDATFGNDLEQIIPGLTESFEVFYGLKQEYNNVGFEMPGYVKAKDGKWYKYNLEINNIYYCPDNIIIDKFEVKHFEKEKYIVLDNFIIDFVNKEIKLYNQDIKDSLPNVIGKIKRIIIMKKGEEKEITIINDKGQRIVIIIDKNNQIIGLKSTDIKEIKNNFLLCNRALEILDLPELQQVGDSFLYCNYGLITLALPKLYRVGNDFLYFNREIKNIDFPLLEGVGENFLAHNQSLIKLELPALHQAGDDFLDNNQSLRILDLPSLQQVGSHFLCTNIFLNSINLPNLVQVGNGFLYSNKSLIILGLPRLKQTGNDFLYMNDALINIDLPLLQKVGNKFLYRNKSLREIELPELQQVGNHFLFHNDYLESLSLPSLEQTGDTFLGSNISLKTLKLPNLHYIGRDFLYSNNVLEYLELPMLRLIESGFLYFNQSLVKLDLPALQDASTDVLGYNIALRDYILELLEAKCESERKDPNENKR